MALPIEAAVAEGSVIGVYTSGEALTKDCRAFLRGRRDGGFSSAADAQDASVCYGFVVGILDKTSVDAKTNIASPGGIPPTFCRGDEVNANDAVEVVARYLDETPERRRFAGYVLVAEALKRAYPCP
ncbi:Rap1a/Tai family immunity protein [Mesorhizobium sp. VNQ89]|uniref:Rap1a/Tai family immunity protein n=1 Tax=Mesorhizobium quangtriensis TaxID=3157709 RepID=UPI0032B7518F